MIERTLSIIKPDAVAAGQAGEIIAMIQAAGFRILAMKMLRLRKELEQAEDPAQRKAELVAEYREKFANPYVAAQRGFIDDVIEPKETRPRLINALEMLQNKRDSNPPRKHGNIPL